MTRFTSNRTISEKFSKWAASISGIAGGNPNGDIWFCGIEFGGSEVGLDFDNSKYDFERSVFPSWDEEYKSIHPEYTKWQYCQKQAKIVCYMKGQINKWKEFLKADFLSSEGDTFCLNLFPINFYNTDHDNWTEEHYKNTGFPCKTEYIAWCIQNRFPFLKQLLTKYNPKVLICAGSSFGNEFLLAFSDDIFDIFKKSQSMKLTNNKEIEWARVNQGRTLLLITPFLGPGGLMRDQSLKEVADFIKSKL